MKTPIGKLQRLAAMAGIAAGSIGVCGALTPVNALTFNFTPTGTLTTSDAAYQGFVSAGNWWSSLFTDNVTINIKVGFSNLGAGTLAEAGSTRQLYSYTDVYNAMNADRASADDNAAVSSLSTSSSFNMLLNRTKNNPNGEGSATTYLDDDGDANNQNVRLNTANAKALGLSVSDPSDAEISFNSSLPTGLTWDFDRSNGIDVNAYDFVGIAAHEIGHALGFVSGVDILDINSSNPYFDDDRFTYVSSLDLFRYSTDSKNQSAIDWTADTRTKYFSLDGGVTSIATFSNGATYGGDGRQASHWKDSLGLGIMDPTTANGELLAISNNDLRAFDVIGWDRASATAVPEPSTWIGTFICAAFGTKLVIKRRKKLAELERDAADKGEV